MRHGGRFFGDGDTIANVAIVFIDLLHVIHCRDPENLSVFASMAFCDAYSLLNGEIRSRNCLSNHVISEMLDTREHETSSTPSSPFCREHLGRGSVRLQPTIN